MYFSIESVSYVLGQLYALSPGRSGAKYPAWTLIRIEPESGQAKPVAGIAPSGIHSIGLIVRICMFIMMP